MIAIADDNHDNNKFPYVYGKDVTRMYPNISITIEVIYPEVAEQMLGTNVHNRDMKRTSFSKDMLEDKWMLNGSTLVWSDDGVLRDGQNRLEACVASGKPFVTIVVRGVPAEAQESMDIGSSRTLGDMLKLRGYPNHAKLAAIIPVIARADALGSLESAFYAKGRGADKFTRRQLLEYVERNYDDMQLGKVAKLAGSVANKREPTAMWGALIREMLKSGEDDTVAFLKEVRGDVPPSQQVFELNKKLKKNREASAGEPPKVMAAWIIKTWNAWLQNVQVSQQMLAIKLGGAHPESFPTMRII
jgi:hypothetical protein